MLARSLRFGALAGLSVGALVAAVMTFLDWWQNPSGIFHDGQGTRWGIVLETAVSWFWPVAISAFVVAAIARFLLALKGANGEGAGG